MQTTVFNKTGLFFSYLKDSFKLFQKNDPLRLAGATAFFANFAIPPILLILIRLFGFFMDRKAFANEIFQGLGNILDDTSTTQIRQTLRNIRNVDLNWLAATLSFVFFIFVATTLFNVIKNSVEQIWNIGQNEKLGVLFTLKLRGRSMVIILLAGILFLIGILSDSLRVLIGQFITNASPTFAHIFLVALNHLLFIAIVTCWFTVLFRFLTNGRPSWKMSFLGGMLTGTLFTLGKFILRIMLPLSNIGTIYGASGSIVLIMLFVFYSSFIFYFGACFVKTISDAYNQHIRAAKGAFLYELKEIITEEES